MQRVNREEEGDLPLFGSSEEAISYFEEKYGEKFVFEETSDIGNGMCFFYRLITDEEAYIKGISELNSTGYIGMEFRNSYKPIQIMEGGNVHIGY